MRARRNFAVKAALVAFLLWTPLAFAQPALVTVQGPVNNVDGTGYTGRITVTNPQIVCASTLITAGTQTFFATNGVFPINPRLYALASCGPGYAYTVSYGRGLRQVSWWVPSSPSTTTVAAVERGYMAPTGQVGLSQIPVIIPANNVLGTVDGVAWSGIPISSLGGGGGGSWGSITGTLSSQTDLWTVLQTIPSTAARVVSLLGTGTTAVSNLGLGGQFQGPLTSYATIAALASYPPSFTPSPHAATHMPGGADALQMWGGGTRPVAANALGVAGNCAQWGVAGLSDTGYPCGTGGGGSGANALGSYIVLGAAQAPANAFILGSLAPGLLKFTVSSGVAIPGTAGTSDVVNLLGTGTTAATNLGLATVAASGSYNDLSGKPTIPAAQVNADWNAGSGLAQILNKPTIPTTAAQVGALADPGSGTSILKRTGANTVAAAGSTDVTNTLGYVPLNPATTQAQNAVYAGPASGGSAAPGFRTLVVADIPSGYAYSSLTGAPTIPTTAAQVGALADPGSGTSILKRTGANTVAAANSSDVTGLLGYVPLNPTTAQAQNAVYAGPSSGGSGAPGFRGLVVGDLPSGYPYGSLSGAPTVVTHTTSALTAAYLIQGNGGADEAPSPAYMDASNILNNPAGFKSSGAGSGFVQMGGQTSGQVTLTVQAVAGTYALALPTSAGSNGQALTTDGNGNTTWTSPATSLPPNGTAAGDLAGSYPNPTVAQIGGAALPAAGSITKTNSSGQLVAATVGADYVSPSGSISGNAGTATALAGTPATCSAGSYARGISAGGNAAGCTAAATGTVTSVTFTGDGTVLSSTPSAAVTASGTLSATLASQAKNTFLAGPASGSNAAPNFRSMVAADEPTQALNYWFPGWISGPQNGANAVLTGSGSANVVRFLIFTLPFNASISKATIFVTTIDASQTADFALYSADGTSRVWHLGAGSGISLGNSNAQSASNTTVTLARGSYMFAWTESGTAGQVYTFNMNTNFFNLLISPTTPLYGTCGNAATSGVLPATCGTLTAAVSAFNTPALMLQP